MLCGLAQLLKFFQRDAQLAQDFEEKRWPDFASAMKWYGYGTPVRVVPTLVTPRLSSLGKAQLLSHLPELARGGARHA